MAVESVNINKAHAKNKHIVAVVNIKTESMFHVADFCENNPAGVYFPLFLLRRNSRTAKINY